MRFSTDETEEFRFARKESYDELSNRLLLRLLTEQLDAPRQERVLPPPKGSDLTRWVIAGLFVLFLLVLSGLIAGYLMVEVIERAP